MILLPPGQGCRGPLATVAQYLNKRGRFLEVRRVEVESEKFEEKVRRPSGAQRGQQGDGDVSGY